MTNTKMKMVMIYTLDRWIQDKNDKDEDEYDLLSVEHGADNSDAVHEVTPLVNNQVFASLQPVEKKISRPAKIIQIQMKIQIAHKLPWCELVWICISGIVKL